MLSRLRQAYIPLFTQITVPYILLALIIASGGTYLVTRLIFDSLEERFANQLIETAVLAKESLVRVEEDLLEAVRLASNIQGVDRVVRQGTVEVLSELVLPGAYNTGVEALAILDGRGQRLLSLYLNPETQDYEVLRETAPYGDLAQVQAVLAGEADPAGDKFGGIVATALGDYFFVSGPITDTEGNLAGVTLVGISVESLAAQARAATLAQISFYTIEGEPLSSTLFEARNLPADLAEETLQRQDEASLTRSLQDSGINYNEIISPWEIRAQEDLGLMGVALPTAILVQASQFTRQNTLLLLGAALLLVVLVGMLVAGRIARPIQALKEASLQVTRGNLRMQVPQRGSNEISILTRSFNNMVDSLYSSEQSLLNAYQKTIEGWAMATDLRDHATEGHSQRVATLAVELSKTMGFKGDDLVHIYRGALLHDIGKIAIPDKILLKKGKLTAAERKTMQRHPELARKFMEQVEFLEPALDIPYAHHEKWDGSGYPRGLKGKEIPLAARIFSIVDVWDALTTERPYRAALSVDETINYIEAEAGGHFDPDVVKAFKTLMG